MFLYLISYGDYITILSLNRQLKVLLNFDGFKF